MHQRRRLQGLAWRFVGHSRRGKFAQFVVNQRQQLLRSPFIPGADGLEDLCHLLRRPVHGCISYNTNNHLDVTTLRQTGFSPRVMPPGLKALAKSQESKNTGFLYHND